MAKTTSLLKLDEYTSKLDPDKDVIWVNKFDEESAKKFSEALIKASKKDELEPIIVYIDSYGGEVDALSTMISVMDSVPNKIITACTGKAMSCGAILLSHGDLRMMAPHARVMVHEISAGDIANVNDLLNSTKEVTRMNKYFMGLLASNCGYKSYKELPFSNECRDIYMNAEKALKFGIIDKIGTPKVEKVVRYDVSVDFCGRK